MANLPIGTVGPIDPVPPIEPLEPVVFDIVLTNGEIKEPLITGNKRIWEESQKARA